MTCWFIRFVAVNFIFGLAFTASVQAAVRGCYTPQLVQAIAVPKPYSPMREWKCAKGFLLISGTHQCHRACRAGTRWIAQKRQCCTPIPTVQRKDDGVMVPVPPPLLRLPPLEAPR